MVIQRHLLTYMTKTWVTKTNEDVMMFKEEKPEVIDNGNVEATYKAEGERYGRDEFDPPTHQNSVYNEGHYILKEHLNLQAKFFIII